MIKIINHKKDIRPVNREFKKISVKYKNPAVDFVGKFEMEITGNPGDYAVILTTGYKDNDNLDNIFIMSQNDLSDLIHQLKSILDECKNANGHLYNVESSYQELYKYIDMGIIEGINLHKIADTYPNYSSMLYIPFRVEPKFKSIQEIKDLELQKQYKSIFELKDEINIGLQFIDCFHIDFNNANPMINKLTNNHPDIPITFSNYDLNAEYKKYRKRIMEEVQGFIPNRNEEHNEQMRELANSMGIEIPQTPNKQ